MKKLLVTGGSGYIGTHTVVELLESGYEVVVYDNLSNSSVISLDRVKEITGKDFEFINGDIRDQEKLRSIFSNHDFEGVIHFAGMKVVDESILKPLEYYDNNVHGTLKLLEVMNQYQVKTIVFSSTAAVYGNPSRLPIDENMPTRTPTNPYGMTKLMVEIILSDLQRSDPSWRIARLRYFNPTGAHPSGLIGEDPRDTPTNLMPLMAQVAIRNIEYLTVYGDDFDTLDGSGVRDFIHVVDLAKGHISALLKCNKSEGVHTVNLGTGQGYSVLEMIETFEKVNNVKVPYKIKKRRIGDVAESYTNPEYASKYLGWQSQLELDDMCRDLWNWQLKNPEGYRKINKV